MTLFTVTLCAGGVLVFDAGCILGALVSCNRSDRPLIWSIVGGLVAETLYLLAVI